MRKIIYLAGGCFWGVEAYFSRLKGVIETMPGYCNGNTAFHHYEDLKSGKATHAETVQVTYDSDVISLEELLSHFLRFVDPYSVNKQGNDVGPQYRSGIYYTDLYDGFAADAFLAGTLKPGWKIEIKKMDNFYPAEEYHQQYLQKHPDGYCHVNLNLIGPDEHK